MFLGKLAVEEEKQEAENNRTKERLLKHIRTDMKKDENDMDTKSLEALDNLTIAKYNKEKTNDEERVKGILLM